MLSDSHRKVLVIVSCCGCCNYPLVRMTHDKEYIFEYEPSLVELNCDAVVAAFSGQFYLVDS